MDDNLLNPDILQQFLQDIVWDQDKPITKPVITTITIEGQYQNVKFLESELINKLDPLTGRIHAVKCNYGKKYQSTPPTDTTPQKAPKTRRIQGTGDCFNSQITFYMTKSTSGYYKFKIFRPGKLQIPGVLPANLHDVISCAHEIATYLSNILNTTVTLQYLRSVMKNYKFNVQMQPNEFLNLRIMQKLLREYAKYDPHNAIMPDPYPDIFDVKYTRQETKLSVRFHTPYASKPQKKVRVNIFMGGKINILGGWGVNGATQQIIDFLVWIITIYEKSIITTPRVPNANLTLPDWLVKLLPTLKS